MVDLQNNTHASDCKNKYTKTRVTETSDVTDRSFRLAGVFFPFKRFISPHVIFPSHSVHTCKTPMGPAERVSKVECTCVRVFFLILLYLSANPSVLRSLTTGFGLRVTSHRSFLIFSRVTRVVLFTGLDVVPSKRVRPRAARKHDV